MTRRNPIPVALVLALFAIGSGASEAVEKPLSDVPSPVTRIEHEDSVTVRIRQLDITVFPRSGTKLSCSQMKASDLRLTVNGDAREIVALDPAGPPLAGHAVGTQGRTVADNREGLAMLLVFDDTSIYQESHNACGRAQEEQRERDAILRTTRSITWARRMLETVFRDGDTVAIATYGDWPVVHSRWLQNREDALLALDELEVSQWLFHHRREHLNDLSWWRGWTTLVDALESYPGRIDLFLLTEKVNVGAREAEELALLAQHAQSSRVVLHTVDVASDRRVLPYGLGSFARHLGGSLYSNGKTLADAVATVRDASCRFLLSFRPFPADSRGFPPRVRVQSVSGDFDVRHGTSFRDEDDEDAREMAASAARILLPGWSDGIELKAGLWPLSPDASGKKWSAVLVVRLAMEEAAASRSLEKTIEAIVWREGEKVEWHLEKTLQDLQPSGDHGRKRLLVFPLSVHSGYIQFHVNLQDVEGAIIATVRGGMEVERVRTPSDAEHWYLSDGFGRVKDQLVPLPRLDGVIRATETLIFVGYSCELDGHGFDTSSAVAIRQKDAQEVPVAVERLQSKKNASTTNTSCGWVIASPQLTLSAGVWGFYPHGSAESTGMEPALVFRIPVPNGGETTGFKVQGSRDADASVQ